jgi:hypothetical protein
MNPNHVSRLRLVKMVTSLVQPVKCGMRRIKDEEIMHFLQSCILQVDLFLTKNTIMFSSVLLFLTQKSAHAIKI